MMKKVEVVSAGSIEVSPFILSEFIAQKDTSKLDKKVSKKALKTMAKELGISYDGNQLEFAKKMINTYLEKLK